MTYQPRYVAYCQAHGRTPEDQLAHDRERWPGGMMIGFIHWVQGQWRAWRAEHGVPADRHLSPADHDAFDEWLSRRVNAEQEAS